MGLGWETKQEKKSSIKHFPAKHFVVRERSVARREDIFIHVFVNLHICWFT